MKAKIGFFVMAFLLLAFADAQSQNQLGPSCKSDFMILTIPEIPQDLGTSWCWAATAQNIMGFHGTKIKQCELVAKVHSSSVNDTLCCGATVTECWGLGGYPEWAFDQFTYSYLPPKDRNNNLTWETATEELCQNRPYIAAIDFVDGDNHSVLVTGYSVKRGVRIYDPLLDGFVWEKRAAFFEGQSHDYERIRDTYKIQPQ